MSAAPGLMYSHRLFLGASPACPRQSRCSVDRAPIIPSPANLKLVPPPEKRKRNVEYGTVFPPVPRNAVTARSNDLCVVSP